MNAWQIIVIFIVAFYGSNRVLKYLRSDGSDQAIENAQSLVLALKLSSREIVILASAIATFVAISRLFPVGQRTTVFIAIMLLTWPFTIFPNLLIQRQRFSELMWDSASRFATLLIAFFHLCVAYILLCLTLNKKVLFPSSFDLVAPYTACALFSICMLFLLLLTRRKIDSNSISIDGEEASLKDRTFDDQIKIASTAFDQGRSVKYTLSLLLSTVAPGIVIALLLAHGAVTSRSISVNNLTMAATVIFGAFFGCIAAHQRRLNHYTWSLNVRKDKLKPSLLPVYRARLFSPLYSVLGTMMVFLAIIALLTTVGYSLFNQSEEILRTISSVTSLSNVVLTSSLYYCLQYSGASSIIQRSVFAGLLLNVASITVCSFAVNLGVTWSVLLSIIMVLGTIIATVACFAFSWEIKHGPIVKYSQELKIFLASLPFAFPISYLESNLRALKKRVEDAKLESSSARKLADDLVAMGLLQSDLVATHSKFKLSATGLQVAVGSTENSIEIPILFRWFLMNSYSQTP